MSGLQSVSHVPAEDLVRTTLRAIASSGAYWSRLLQDTVDVKKGRGGIQVGMVHVRLMTETRQALPRLEHRVRDSTDSYGEELDGLMPQPTRVLGVGAEQLVNGV